MFLNLGLIKGKFTIYDSFYNIKINHTILGLLSSSLLCYACVSEETNSELLRCKLYIFMNFRFSFKGCSCCCHI